MTPEEFLNHQCHMSNQIDRIMNPPELQSISDTIKFDSEDLKWLREIASDSPSAIRTAKNISEIEKSLDDKLHQHTEQIASTLADISEQQKAQAESQKNIYNNLKEESISRSKDDKKYFWLGTLVSLVTSILVEHGSDMIRFLQQLFQ